MVKAKQGQATAPVRNRIKELRYVHASTLKPNPHNWRTHPQDQRNALQAALAQIGYADALVAYEVGDDLMLLDGHLRAETTPDDQVPVLVVDLNQEEADLLLATLDPLSAMAERDQDTLNELLSSVTASGAGLQALLASLKPYDALARMQEWKGMPGYEQENESKYSLIVYFESEKARQTFAKTIKQTVLPTTKSVWFPPQKRKNHQAKVYTAT